MNDGKEGERLFQKLMSSRGNIVQNVAENSNYWSKDSDFIITSPFGNTKSFEVKWCQKINKTNNLFLEIANPRSRQWNGEGWWKHCEADYLVYGDAIARKFYIIPMPELRQRVDSLLLTTRSTSDGSVGKLLPLCKIKDIITLELSENFDF